MEIINTINQLKRQAIRTEEKKAAVSESTESASSSAQPKADSITWTERAVTELREQNQRIMNLLQQDQEPEKLPSLLGMTKDSEDTKSDMLDSLGEQMKVMERCHKIAMRIMRGDKVPPQDEQYLMQNDPEGYKLALAMRKPKRKPKEWDSVLKDDEKKTDGNDSSEETTASCEESSGTSDTGGDASPDSGE